MKTAVATTSNLGKVVPGAPLFKLAGAGGQLQLAASVGEAEAGALKVAQPVEFHRPRLRRPHLPGSSRRPAPPHGRALGPPPAGGDRGRGNPPELRPGMSAVARIRTTSEGVTSRVPSVALLFAPGGMTTSRENPSVWLVDPKHQLRQVPVEVRVHDGAFAEVLGEGLREGAGAAVGYTRRPSP